MEVVNGKPKQAREAKVSRYSEVCKRSVYKDGGKIQKTREEEARATGITGAEFDEVYQGMVDIFDRMDEAKINWDNESDLEKEKQNLEKSKAEDMRKKATESLSETRKRKEEEGEETIVPRRKRKTTEAFSLCQEGLKMKK